MTAGRFAGILPFLGRTWGAVRPRGRAEWAGELANNALFAGLSAASLPEGTPMELRAGAALEDAAFSIPLGLLGRGGGYLAGRGIGRMRGNPLSPGGMGMVSGVGSMGLETGVYATGLVPRPFANQAWGLAEAQVQEEADRRKLAEQEAMRQQMAREMAQQMGGFGAALGAFQPMPGLPAPAMGMFG